MAAQLVGNGTTPAWGSTVNTTLGDGSNEADAGAGGSVVRS